MLLPVGLVIAAGWLLATAVGGRDRRRAGDEANAILRRCLAAGGIDVERYEQARAALGLADGGLEEHVSR